MSNTRPIILFFVYGCVLFLNMDEPSLGFRSFINVFMCCGMILCLLELKKNGVSLFKKKTLTVPAPQYKKKVKTKFLHLNQDEPKSINDLVRFGISSVPDRFSVNDNQVLLFKFLPCIAMVYVGTDLDSPDIKEMLQPDEKETVLVAQHEWRMPQLLKALGVFESTTLAIKNNWNKDIPVGYSEHKVKHSSKVKGIICIWKE